MLDRQAKCFVRFQDLDWITISSSHEDQSSCTALGSAVPELHSAVSARQPAGHTLFRQHSCIATRARRPNQSSTSHKFRRGGRARSHVLGENRSRIAVLLHSRTAIQRLPPALTRTSSQIPDFTNPYSSSGTAGFMAENRPLSPRGGRANPIFQVQPAPRALQATEQDSPSDDAS